MTRRLILLVLLGATALAQWAVPVWRIVRQERILHLGRVFKFRTAPVDPFDALRGRYVALDFEANFVPEVAGVVFPAGSRMYALIEEDAEGFARLAGLVKERPEGDAAVPVEVGYTYQGKVRVDLPFERYYLEEDLAPEAEAAYREHTRTVTRDAYVTVRVWKGRVALEELYVGGKPIREFLAGRGAAERP